MSQINSNTKDDFQVVLLLSCFVGHPVALKYIICIFNIDENISPKVASICRVVNKEETAKTT